MFHRGKNQATLPGAGLLGGLACPTRAQHQWQPTRCAQRPGRLGPHTKDSSAPQKEGSGPTTWCKPPISPGMSCWSLALAAAGKMHQATWGSCAGEWDQIISSTKLVQQGKNEGNIPVVQDSPKLGRSSSGAPRLGQGTLFSLLPCGSKTETHMKQSCGACLISVEGTFPQSMGLPLAGKTPASGGQDQGRGLCFPPAPRFWGHVPGSQ